MRAAFFVPEPFAALQDGYFRTYPRNSESVFSELAVAHEIARDTLERDIRSTIFRTLPDKKPKAA